MKIKAYITTENRTQQGQLKSFSKKKARSFVKALIDFLYTNFNNAGATLGAQDTGGTARTMGVYMARLDAGAGIVTHGIRVGTGTNAVAVTDYALQTPIAEGSGSGQLNHTANSGTAPITSGTSRQLTVSRSFANNSGGDIAVKEVAIYASINGVYFCLDRTLNTFTISNGTTTTVTYTIKVTV